MKKLIAMFVITLLALGAVAQLPGMPPRPDARPVPLPTPTNITFAVTNVYVNAVQLPINDTTPDPVTTVTVTARATDKATITGGNLNAFADLRFTIRIKRSEIEAHTGKTFGATTYNEVYAAVNQIAMVRVLALLGKL